jgi:hypothetical protein
MADRNNRFDGRERFFDEDLVVVNIGIKKFYEDLKIQGVKVVHVDWEPPAGGDERLIALLDRIL